MIKHTNQEILAAARYAKECILTGKIPHKGVGVCGNFFHGIRDSYLEPYLRTWKHFSGCTGFPVPATAKRWERGAGRDPKVAADRQYSYTTDLYRGEQKYLRLDLLDHIISMCGGEV